KRRPAQLIAARSNGGPVQIVAAAPCLLDELDDLLLRPARASDNLGIVHARALDGRTIRSEMIRCRRQQRLPLSCQRIVRQLCSTAVQPAQLLQDALLVPGHETKAAGSIVAYRFDG